MRLVYTTPTIYVLPRMQDEWLDCRMGTCRRVHNIHSHAKAGRQLVLARVLYSCSSAGVHIRTPKSMLDTGHQYSITCTALDRSIDRSIQAGLKGQTRLFFSLSRNEPMVPARLATGLLNRPTMLAPTPFRLPRPRSAWLDLHASRQHRSRAGGLKLP